MTQRINFCTLFNAAYLSRGLVLYESLLEHCSDFHLYVFAFDDAVVDYFRKTELKYVTVISLQEFEDEILLKIKSTRSEGEYCWTCTPSTILYCIQTYNLPSCTYLDADMLFYSDPLVLFEEREKNSIIITEHRYTEKYDQSLVSGRFCVQFVSVRNDPAGLKALKWWRDSCIEWCYARVEDGKFGDQKYLDEWPVRFEGIHELKHLGGGLAPWNVQQYKFVVKNNQPEGKEISTGKKFSAVFFHFHSLKFYKNNIISYSKPYYLIDKEVKQFFYEPYLKKLIDAGNRIRLILPEIDPHGIKEEAPGRPLSFVTLIPYYIHDFFSSGKFTGPKVTLLKLHRHLHYYTTAT